VHHLLYSELVDWYRLVDPPADHAEEAECFRAAFERVVQPLPETLLELGAGAGHNAVHLKAHFRCTLVDLSPEMVALSRELNPECEHHVADMRTVRLGKTYDVVLIHDAIVYMTSKADLSAAIATAFEHTRPGGAVLIAPDAVRDSWQENTRHEHSSDGARTVHFLMWDWDPDPSDDSYLTEYAFLLRDGQTVRAVHDRHEAGLFARATWLQILETTGFQVELIDRPIGDGECDQVFLCRKADVG
jgi:SAM-dependent methyltransferase